jgi:DNA polymerase-1
MEYAPTADTVERDYRIVRSVEDLDALIRGLRQAGRFGLRTIPDTSTAMRASIVGIAFSDAPRRAWYLPLAHETLGDSPEIERAEALALLKPLFEDATVVKVGHDLKFDTIVLARHGITLRGGEIDTMIASYLLDATRSSHGLEDTALERVTYKALSEEDVCGRGPKAVSFAHVPVEATLKYAGERADLTLQLADSLLPSLREEGLEGLYRDMEMRSSRSWPRSSAPACGSTSWRSRGSPPISTGSWRHEARRSSRWQARSSTSTRRSSSRRSCSRS